MTRVTLRMLELCMKQFLAGPVTVLHFHAKKPLNRFSTYNRQILFVLQFITHNIWCMNTGRLWGEIIYYSLDISSESLESYDK